MISKIVAASVAALFLAACNPSTGERTERADTVQQDDIMRRALTVGYPIIRDFAERNFLKDVYEFRDRMPATKTYLVSDGKIGHKICDSVGFAIPASTAYTNPSRIAGVTHQGGHAVLPQTGPNGLYEAPSRPGYWVLCNVPGTERAEPQFVGSEIVVLTF